VQTVTIDPRFNGPPDSANGGYVSGLVAGMIEGSAEITLRAPPPLSKALTLEPLDDGRVFLLDGDTLLAEGRATTVDLALPPPVTLAEAINASTRYSGIAFPRCFVCGSARANDGGLMILPGTVADRSVVAAPWTPSADLADAQGFVDARFVWSALDCPSWFAHAALTPPEQLNLALLGRISAHIEQRPRTGQPCVVMGWPLKQEGRRIFSASALFDTDGQALAWASATWIELKSA